MATVVGKFNDWLLSRVHNRMLPLRAFGSWVYTLRVTQLLSSESLQPLEDVLRQVFLSALTGQSAPNDVTRDLLALPCRLGGMYIINPTTMFKRQYTASTEIRMPIVNIIHEKQECSQRADRTTTDRASHPSVPPQKA